MASISAVHSVAELLSWGEATLGPAPSHQPSFPDWQEEAEALIDEVNEANEVVMNAKEKRAFEAAKEIGFAFLEAFLSKAGATKWSAQPATVRVEAVKQLLERPQIPQRTPAWYAQGKEVLTASEFATLFGSPRAFSQLVMSKVPMAAAAAVTVSSAATPAIPQTNRLACMTCEMGPFDWGIRFEPVVKQYLERTWGTQIAESGRLLHPTDNRLAASPDGLILAATDPRRVGRLIEIKCPITRKVGAGVPFEYWCQMQLQMEVTGIDECEYVEVKIQSVQKHETELPGDARPDGYLWLLQGPSTAMSYAYTEDERVRLEADGWECIEVIPWRVAEMWAKTVVRDRAWFEGTGPTRERFWKDVEQARAGSYQLVESSRPRRAAPAPLQVIVQKEDSVASGTGAAKGCLIQDD